MNAEGNRTTGGGGMATQAGIGYQNRVAAWLCVRILSERAVAPLWRLKTDVTFDYIRCETGQPVDDLLVGTSEGGHLFINVKHTVTKSRATSSFLGSAINQMAVDLIVKLVERFIAEYGYILRENDECRRVLIEILDVFVEAGWASARRLTYRMEEIFR